ncbi:MAG: hypothetical protein U5L01_16305 [Rheinheimera sp.]|nr:hypothetical protein [Rheinheimera sp.]
MTEHSQIYQPSPITISNYFNQTNITTRQYTLGAGYIFELSEHTTFDINGSIGRMKLKVDDFHQMDSEQTTTTFLLRSHHYSTVAGYNARLHHEFTEDLEFYTSIGGERWYADEDDTISVQTIGLNYFIFDETAISYLNMANMMTKNVQPLVCTLRSKSMDCGLLNQHGV